MAKHALGERIASARERAGMNKNQLARELGTSWQHVDHWEKGRTEPSLASLRRIGEVLRVSIDTLLGAQEGAMHSALERFLAERDDLTSDEEEWLRRAPIDPAQAAPEDYRRLLDGLRKIAHRPKSGRRRKVEPAALEQAIVRRRSGRP